jgi:hypothetical protein
MENYEYKNYFTGPLSVNRAVAWKRQGGYMQTERAPIFRLSGIGGESDTQTVR